MKPAQKGQTVQWSPQARWGPPLQPSPNYSVLPKASLGNWKSYQSGLNSLTSSIATLPRRNSFSGTSFSTFPRVMINEDADGNVYVVPPKESNSDILKRFMKARGM